MAADTKMEISTRDLILYTFLAGIEDQQSLVVLFMTYIGSGCGGAALRLSLP